MADDLYTVNLATGVATLAGQIGSNSNFNTIAIALLPVLEPSTYISLLLGGAVMFAVLWRHHHAS